MLLAAYAAAKGGLPAYAHKYSPKKFTQHQLFSCLVLKTFLKVDYRKLCCFLSDCPSLCETIDLHEVPHFTTLQKASRRLLRSTLAEHLMDSTLRMLKKHRRRVKLAAMDSSGLESSHVSSYYVRRRSREPNVWQTTQYTRFPKLSVVCDCQHHVILAALTGRGPSVDVNQFRKTLTPLLGKVCIEHLVADAGYDSESNHAFARDQCGIRTTIPPKAGGSSKTKLPSGTYRREMRLRFDKKAYGQRWQVETVFSMIKRNFGSALRARSYWAQRREMMLLVLTHNIAIIYLFRGFLQSTPDPFGSSPLEFDKWSLSFWPAERLCWPGEPFFGRTEPLDPAHRAFRSGAQSLSICRI